MKRIKSGDEVIVIAGKSKGHIGKVLRVIDDAVVVEGGNLIKKHIKPNPQKPENKGGIIAREAPLHVSNVAHYNPVTKRLIRSALNILRVMVLAKRLDIISLTMK